VPTTEEMLSAWENDPKKPKKKRTPKKSPYELAYEADLKFIEMYESNPSNYDRYIYRLAKIDVKRYKLERGLLTDKEKKEIIKRKKARIKNKNLLEKQRLSKLQREEKELIAQQSLAIKKEENKQSLIKKNKKEEEDQMIHNLKVENNQLNSIFKSLKQAQSIDSNKQQMLDASIATVKSLNDIDWQLSFDAADRRR